PAAVLHRVAEPHVRILVLPPRRRQVQQHADAQPPVAQLPPHLLHHSLVRDLAAQRTERAGIAQPAQKRLPVLPLPHAQVHHPTPAPSKRRPIHGPPSIPPPRRVRLQNVRPPACRHHRYRLQRSARRRPGSPRARLRLRQNRNPHAHVRLPGPGALRPRSGATRRGLLPTALRLTHLPPRHGALPLRRSWPPVRHVRLRKHVPRSPPGPRPRLPRGASPPPLGAGPTVPLISQRPQRLRPCPATFAGRHEAPTARAGTAMPTPDPGGGRRSSPPPAPDIAAGSDRRGRPFPPRAAVPLEFCKTAPLAFCKASR